MARPIKQGLDYFSFDVDFYDNRKVRKIMRACGPAAGSILTCLLCSIYHGKGYYILWDQDLPFDIADKLGMSEGPVSEVINKSVQVDFFDQHQFQVNKILTSSEIQRRYKAGTAKRHEVKIDSKFLVSEDRKRVNGGNNVVNSSDNTESKVKESTGKETKVNEKPIGFRLDEAAQARRRELKKVYGGIVSTLDGKEKVEIWNALRSFIEENKPDFPDPYADIWNLFSSSYKLSKIEGVTDSRRKKFETRVREAGFDFIRILEKIKTSTHLKGDNRQSWKVTFDWILENDKNYLKILEGNYD
jgi:hypothetical protein